MEAALAVREKVAAHLVDKWGPTPPPCPYCRYTAWNIDAAPIVIQRWGEAPGFGVPMFLVWCTNCGHEVFIAVSATGLWEDALGYPEPTAETVPPALGASTTGEAGK